MSGGKYPTTPDEMNAAGYLYLDSSKCRNCGAEIDWWENLSHKRLPFNAGSATLHPPVCPEASGGAAPPKRSDIEATVAKMREAYKALEARVERLEKTTLQKTVR